MIDIIKKFFNGGVHADHPEAKADIEHNLHVATCALFLEIGSIDETFTQEEMDTILSILKEKYGLSGENADALIKEADKRIAESVDDWRFADLINKNYSNEEKIAIVENLWRIVFVDGKMDKYEHYLMNKLGNLLRLSHSQLMDAKMKVLHPQNLEARSS